MKNASFVAAVVLLIAAFYSFASEILTPTPYAPTEFSETYNASCGSNCQIDGKFVTEDELANHVPILRVMEIEGPTWECEGRFCYRKSDGRVLGLSPFNK